MERYQFEFQATGASLRLCEDVVDRMMELFGISAEEALGRVNRKWGGRDLDNDSLICHEDQDYWANNIYYGHDSFWWLKPAGLEPLPYP
jgi:hypothetical protein